MKLPITAFLAGLALTSSTLYANAGSLSDARNILECRVNPAWRAPEKVRIFIAERAAADFVRFENVTAAKTGYGVQLPEDTVSLLATNNFRALDGTEAEEIELFGGSPRYLKFLFKLSKNGGLNIDVRRVYSSPMVSLVSYEDCRPVSSYVPQW